MVSEITFCVLEYFNAFQKEERMLVTVITISFVHVNKQSTRERAQKIKQR
mgnify:CR=1 FL=1